MKRYMVSRNLDLYVEYYVTKMSNLIDDCIRYNKPVTETQESRQAALLEVQQDLFLENDGTFTVSSKNYTLACKCRDSYRACH